MNTDGHGSGPAHGDLTRAVIGCAMEVLNALGHGLDERQHENALAGELRLRGIPHHQQRRFPVTYKEQLVGEPVPDLIAQDSVIMDAKVVESITDHERGQMLNYLRIARLPVGLIINFRYPRLHWERIVL